MPSDRGGAAKKVWTPDGGLFAEGAPVLKVLKLIEIVADDSPVTSLHPILILPLQSLIIRNDGAVVMGE
jgi:hypothetical protein